MLTLTRRTVTGLMFPRLSESVLTGFKENVQGRRHKARQPARPRRRPLQRRHRVRARPGDGDRRISTGWSPCCCGARTPSTTGRTPRLSREVYADLGEDNREVPQTAGAGAGDAVPLPQTMSRAACRTRYSRAPRMRSKPFPYCGNTTSDGRDGLRLSGHLQWLISAARGDVSVGIGLLPGDPREEELLLRASFCPVTVFREPVGMLEALGRGDIKAAVRGSLPAGAFLRELKKRRPGVGVRRIAMLALPDGRRFLLGPVGIDEGGTLRGMRMLIEDSRVFCALLGWEPRVGVLSAGRPEDAGRGREIARSISRGERLLDARRCEALQHNHRGRAGVGELRDRPRRRCREPHLPDTRPPGLGFFPGRAVLST